MAFNKESSVSSWRKVPDNNRSQSYTDFVSRMHSIQYTPDGKYGLSVRPGFPYKFSMVNMITGEFNEYNSDENVCGEIVNWYWLSNTELVVVNFATILCCNHHCKQKFEQLRFNVCHKEKKLTLSCEILETSCHYVDHWITDTRSMPWEQGATRMVYQGKEYLLISNEAYFTFVPWDPSVHRECFGLRLNISKERFDQQLNMEYCILKNVFLETVKFDLLTPGNGQVTPNHIVYQQGNHLIVKYEEPFGQQLNVTSEIFIVDLERRNVARTMMNMNSTSVLTLYKSSLLAWQNFSNTEKNMVELKIKTQPIRNNQVQPLEELARNSLILREGNKFVPELYFRRFFR